MWHLLGRRTLSKPHQSNLDSPQPQEAWRSRHIWNWMVSYLFQNELEFSSIFSPESVANRFRQIKQNWKTDSEETNGTDPLRCEILTEWDFEKRKNYRWHCWSFISKGFVPVLKQVQYFCLPFLQSSLNFGVDFCFSSNFYLLICLFDCFSFEGSQCRDLGGNWLTTVCLYCNCNFSYRKLHPPSSVIVHHPT